MKIQKIIIAVLLVCFVYGLKVKDFEPSLFKFTSIEEGFRVIETGEQRSGEVMGFTDLDGDRFTDYVAVQNRNTSQVLFYIWDQEKQQFIMYRRNLIVQLDIEEIITYDLNQNGQNQLIITGRQKNSSYKTLIFTSQCTLCQENLTLLSNSQISNQSTVPILIDNEGNGVVKLLIFTKDNQRTLYSYDFSNNSYSKSSFSSIVQNTNHQTIWNPVQKHFASTIDLNNDCFADLMLVSYKNTGQDEKQRTFTLETYQKLSNNNLKQTQAIELKSNQSANDIPVSKFSINQVSELLMVTFVDIDNAGAADLIFLYQSQGKILMRALLNDFFPSEVCQTSDRGIFPNQQFDFLSLPLLELPSDYSLSHNSILHFNDVNADGLPDLLTLMELNGYTKVVILINEGNLRFNKYDDQWRSYDLNNPHQALFYDYGQDGKMDIMIFSQQKKTVNNITTLSYTRTSIINNLQSDTLHLKILPLSITSSYIEDEKKIENTFGVTTQWLFTDIDGHKHVKISNQKYQYNYKIMQLPYAYTGLGRTNNYLEQFTVGYQRYGQKEDWSPIIPNSQLMVYKENGHWKLETLLKNNERVNDVIYVSVMILLCMGCVVFYLNYKEAQQDKRDHYNFIQLIR